VCLVFCGICRAANHYDFCGRFTIFCSSLCMYSENYDKSPFSCNSSLWCSSVTVLATHCITRLACILGSIPRLSLVQHSLYGAHHAAVTLEHMVWKPLLCQWIGIVYFYQEGPEKCGGDVFYLCRRSSFSYSVSWYRDSNKIWQSSNRMIWNNAKIYCCNHFRCHIYKYLLNIRTMLEGWERFWWAGDLGW